MITQLRGRSQITLPSDVVKKMKLQEGDNLDIAIEDDRIISSQLSSLIAPRRGSGLKNGRKTNWKSTNKKLKER